MTTPSTDQPGDVDSLRLHMEALAATVRAALTQNVTATSEDETVEAGAAGRRLTSMVITPAGERAPHETLVAAMQQAAQRALGESARVISAAAIDTGMT